MRFNRSLSFVCLLLLVCALPGAAIAYATPESIVAAGKVYVSNVTVDPEVFFTGDTGIITVEVANGASEQGIVFNHALIADNDIRTISGFYDTSTNIGPARYSAAGNIPTTRTFAFSIVADPLDGTYYPTFSLSFRDAGSLYYRIPVKVDNTPLELTVLDKPDAFAQGAKKTIYLQVANPRQNRIRTAILEASGDGITVNPSRIFIGYLDPGEIQTLNLSVTPQKETVLRLNLSYNNGDNPHETTLALPVVFGKDKKQADPVMSNVQIKTDAGIYHVTGDVNNAGLETANTVTVTSLAPAEPQDPYKVYVVGALKPDDFGSFEVTFTAPAGTTSIPVQPSFKDADGNIYNTVQDVKISSGLLASTETGSSSNILPVAVAIVIVLVFVGGWVIYLRRNKK